MKKTLFIAALAIAALASCSENDFVGDTPSPNSNNDVGAISFGTGTKAVTRATGSEAATLLDNNFVVVGVKSNGTITANNFETVFDHYNVNYATSSSNSTTSNTAGWEYVAQEKTGAYSAYGAPGEQSIKYWDYAKSQYDFIAWSKGTATVVYADNGYSAGTNVQISEIDPTKLNGVTTNNVITDGAYKIKGNAADLAQVYIADLVTAYRDVTSNDGAGDYGKEVEIKFRSLGAKARIGLYETVPGYSVKQVVFYTDASTAATNNKAYLYTTGDDVFNDAGEYIVYFPTTGSTHKNETDYNKAHLVLSSTGATTSKMKEFDVLDANTYVNKQDKEDDVVAAENVSDKLYIGRSSDHATYAGAAANHHYTTVLPNEAGAVLNLMVDYQLVSTDGSGETIDVTKATAQVPSVYAQWKSGYAYTYLFKIGPNTNGWTNPAITDKAGLTAITLDAIVVESEDSVQETITTVATPSITTFAKGKVVTENDEYTTGSNIYVIVGNGLALTKGTNANLYTVALDETGAAQTINEASVANALAGTGNEGVWTVTDKNNKTMTVTLVNGDLSTPNSIAAGDAPGGNAISVNCAKFTPSVAGTIYAFEYTTETTYVQATGTFVEGRKYYSLSNETYSEVDTSSFNAETSVSSYYVVDTPAQKVYKIIKIQESNNNNQGGNGGGGNGD